MISKGLLVLLLASFFGFSFAKADGPKGLSFTESMSGFVWIDGEKEKVEVKFKATAEDIDQWYADPHHTATLVGYVKYKKKKYAAHGTLEMMTAISPNPGEKGHFLTYRFTIDDPSAPFTKFEGVKRVYNDHELDLMTDATTLRGTFVGADCGCMDRAILKFHWEKPWVSAKFLLSFRTINANPIESGAVIFKFLKVWLGGIYEEFIKNMPVEGMTRAI